MSKKHNPETVKVAMLQAGLEPLEAYKNALTKWKCKCLNCGEIVFPKYNQIQQGNGGCNKCGTERGSEKIKLDSNVAIQTMRNVGLEPLEDYVNTKAKWKCKCLNCGEIVFPQLSGIRSGEGGCYKCGMKKAGQKNTLNSEQAIEIMKVAGFTALESYTNALTKWKMRHDACGSIVYPTLNTISNRAGKTPGCAVCAGKQVEVGLNDLQTTHPAISKEALNWDPTTVTPGSNLKKLWKCGKGHEWRAHVTERTSGHGCPSCAQNGFDPNKDGWLYFLSHPDWEMLQIGITNVPNDRLSTHKRLGWEVIEIKGPMNGDLARRWETDILRILRAKNAKVGETEIAGKFSGYTESWLTKSFPVTGLNELMEIVRVGEGDN
ncbi:MAG: zinc-ribbon domain-containing protein [Actinomycetota bacterium]|nr:zinc-ribbon domain-containing protein [Actinomycetota bacterium]